MASVEQVQVSHDGGGPIMRRLVVAHLREEGFSAARDGRHQQAEAYLRRALSLDGEDADLWALLGTVSSDDQVRWACARQALALSPEHPAALALLEEASSPPSLDPFRLPRPSLRTKARSAPRAWNKPRRATTRDPLIPQPGPILRPAPRLAETPPLALPYPVQTQRQRQPATVALPAAPAKALPARLVWARLLALMILLILLAVDAALGNAYIRQYEDQFLPGVRIAGIDVGGLSQSEVQGLLREQVGAILNQAVLLRYKQQTWQFTPEQVGLRYRIDEACQEGWSFGRESWLERERVSLWGKEVPLVAEVRAGPLQALLDRVEADLNRPALPPDAAWREESGWTIQSGQDGREVLRGTTERYVLDVLAALVHGEEVPPGMLVVVDLPVITKTASLPPAIVAELEEQLQRAGQPLTLQCEEYTWTLEATDIAEWTRVKVASPPGDVSIQVDREVLRDQLSRMAMDVARPVGRPRIEVNGEGRVTIFETGQPGRRLKLAEAVDQVEQVFLQRLEGEQIALVELLSEVIPAGDDVLTNELGVVEWVGAGSSSFAGSPPNRAHNILIGGQELHGRLIAPDEIFSLNAALDPITWQKGYVMSEMIVGGDVVMGLGGGLCQVATTLYRAALYSGLEIIERHPHMWRLDWYEQDSAPGFDATIALGGPDLKFRNNTDYYLLIQAYTDLATSQQTVQFYGTAPGWQISIDNFYISPNGLEVSYLRTVTLGDQIVRQDTFYSRYLR